MVKKNGHHASGLALDHLAMVVTSNICRTAQAFKLKMEHSVLRGHGLSFAAFSTLFLIWSREPIETRAIAASEGVSRATVTSTVTLLESRGLVTRRTSEKDRRLVLVGLTARGKKLTQSLFPNFKRVQREIACNLTRAQQETLARLLARFWAGIRKDAEEFVHELQSPNGKRFRRELSLGARSRVSRVEVAPLGRGAL